MFDLIGNEAIVAGKYTRDIDDSKSLVAFIDDNDDMESLSIDDFVIYKSFVENLSESKALMVSLYRDIVELDRDKDTGGTDVALWYYTSYESDHLKEIDLTSPVAISIIGKMSKYINKYKSITEDATDVLFYNEEYGTYIYTIDNFDALDFPFMMNVIYDTNYTILTIDDGISHREFLYENDTNDIIWYNTESLDGKSYQFSSKEMFVECKYSEKDGKEIIRYRVNDDVITIIFDGNSYFADSDSIMPGTEIFIRNKYGIPVKHIII